MRQGGGLGRFRKRLEGGSGGVLSITGDPLMHGPVVDLALVLTGLPKPCPSLSLRSRSRCSRDPVSDPLPPTTTIMEQYDDSVLMTAQAAPTGSKVHPSKKSSGKKSSRSTSALNAIAEYSLDGFLVNEPDIYSVSDIKVRYR